MKGFVHLSAVPVRATASDRAEMVNQLLFGETVELVQREEKWSLVRSDYDGYEGWVDNKQVIPFDSAADLAERLYLDTPYLWGGRSAGGIDCSGLTQVCFKALGAWLPRDASQQVTSGVEVCQCDIRRDDLAFFRTPGTGVDGIPAKIVHVGICLGDGRIIHSSGCVRIDTLDTQGIYNEKAHAYSHELHCVRRVYGF